MCVIAGEANSGASNYDCMFQAMINDWRSKFSVGTLSQTDATFPFGFVQVFQMCSDTQRGSPFDCVCMGEGEVVVEDCC